MATERGKALAFRFVHEVEAGLVDDPKDPGGITNFGVSLRFLRGAGIDIDGDGEIDREDILKLTPEKAQAIYDAHFWKPAGCDALPDALSLAVYDCAVNQGVPVVAEPVGKVQRGREAREQGGLVGAAGQIDADVQVRVGGAGVGARRRGRHGRGSIWRKLL